MTRVLAAVMAISAALAGQVRPQADAPLWAPPATDLPDELPKSDVKEPILTHISLAGIPIRFEETTLDAVARRLGASTGQKGDAGEYQAWLCLHGEDGEGTWALWLISGEIDGPAIGGFEWQRVPAGTKFDSRCKSLDQSVRSISLPVELRLGMSESQAAAVLGKPNSRFRETSIYVSEQPLVLHRSAYSAVNAVYLTYKQGKLYRMVVNYTISS